MKNIKYAIEGILFAAGESVKAAKLAIALNCEITEVKDAVEELKDEYNNEKRGFTIIDIDDGYQICSRPEYYAYIQEILGEQRRMALSNAAMETLAIIAYKQPITKSGIEYIRGINSDGSVNRLLERSLVEEKGRLNAPGRPFLYGTTIDFLRCFSLKNLSELPPINLESVCEGIDDVEEKDILPAEADTDGKNIISADDYHEENDVLSTDEDKQQKDILSRDDFIENKTLNENETDNSEQNN